MFSGNYGNWQKNAMLLITNSENQIQGICQPVKMLKICHKLRVKMQKEK